MKETQGSIIIYATNTPSFQRKKREKNGSRTSPDAAGMFPHFLVLEKIYKEKGILYNQSKKIIEV